MREYYYFSHKKTRKLFSLPNYIIDITENNSSVTTESKLEMILTKEIKVRWVMDNREMACEHRRKEK